MKLLDALLRPREVARYTPPPWMDPYLAGGMPSLPGYTTSYGVDKAEQIGDSFTGYVVGGLQGNGVIWAVERVRVALFCEARFQFQRFYKGRPGDLFGTPGLALLERPWDGGTTGDLLARMILDADFSGNFFAVELDGEIVRLRPDWVEVVLTERYDVEGMQVGWKRLAYLYYEGGRQGQRPAVFLPHEVVHFAPMPDPLAGWRGMSWLTPVVREVMADTQATRHKLKFFENAAPMPLHSKILTPHGWSTMGQMKLGMQVIGSDGKPHRVTGVFPQGEQDIYRVTFSDGAQVECTYDHLWHVANAYDRKRGTHRVLSLKEIVEGSGRYGAGTGAGSGGVRYGSGPAKWSVPLVDPIEFADPGPMPLAPYLLGALLGDGSFGRCANIVSFSAAAEDAQEMRALLEPLLPAGASGVWRDRGGWSEAYFRGPGGRNPLNTEVRRLGLWRVLGEHKYIPEPYLRAGVMDRLAMLQGLLDTDGSGDKRQPNVVRFTNTSQLLSIQVAELARSLGGIARITPLRKRGGKLQWSVLIKRLPEWIVPFRLSRKAQHYIPPSNRAGRWRYITGVEHIGREQAQCIRVDVDDHLYVTDDYVLTHNTPNLAVSLPKELDPDAFQRFVDKMDTTHRGADNAYKTLYTGGGADVTVVGADMRQLDFKVTQGAGEARIASAGGIHPAIAGLSEGLQGSSLNAGNFGAARRVVADGTMRPLWRNAAGSLEVLMPPPPDARLWYDDRDVSFLREDAKDAAEIIEILARTITTLVKEGFTPESSKAAVLNQNMDLLEHTGMMSVQLQPPGGPQDIPAAEKTARAVSELLQKVHLGVGSVITPDEARALLNKAGAGLGSAPELASPRASPTDRPALPAANGSGG